MPDSPSKDSTQVAAVMPKSLKEQLREFAKSRRWTMSQAIVYFVELGLEGELEVLPPAKTKAGK